MAAEYDDDGTPLDVSRARGTRPKPLDEDTLCAFEDGCLPEREELVELLRVYRLAIKSDESDDVSPYNFFFE